MKHTSLKIDSSLLLLGKTKEISEELSSFIADLNLNKACIAKLECYISLDSSDDIISCQTHLTDSFKQLFGEHIPAFSLINQQAADISNKALLKLTLFDEPDSVVSCKEFQKHPYTVVTINDDKLVFSGGIHFTEEKDILRSIQLSYDFAEQLLDHEEMHMGHLATVSNYMEDLEGKNIASTGWSNLATLEEVRSLYFDPTLFKHGYPLLLNNSIKTGAFCIDFIAASKDGFPTAQYQKNTNGLTQSCYLPCLQKVLIGNLSTQQANSIDEQIDFYKTAIEAVISNYSSSEILIEELKILLTNPDLAQLVEDELTNLLHQNKTSVFHTQSNKAEHWFDIEVIASVTCDK
ncbi:hypothetical protein KEM09_16530 [Carboxylicivirga mesophila]|uniref:Uncharacterized protein n=1 Tax=Carboxylicivirga mesophila TaxID=1166478 RepID=A0ABS5KDI5_9BACT|nr:hypothetical protein [Carboxylicivirga mesophila]MBS2213026.1 hypothetical protein [Carboxylicivirga mesophila]